MKYYSYINSFMCIISLEVIEMKKVVLCGGGSSCCPAVEFHEKEVLIGEDDNIVKLTKEEWQILKDKIKKGEL